MTQISSQTHQLTLMGTSITTAVIEQVIQLLEAAGYLNISVHRLSEQAYTIGLTHNHKDQSTDSLQTTVLAISTELKLDVALQREQSLDLKPGYKLICFDMDSTLIQNEVMDEIAITAGIGEKISAITETAMRGEISFKESFTQRLALLEGFPSNKLPKIANRLRLSPGAKVLISTLRSRGLHIALFSGGFTYFAEGLQKQLGPLDHIHANQLEIVDGHLTGKITGELIDENAKARLIQEIAKQLNIDLKQTIAVGDGANDIPMLKLAGMGVAYHAKPIVRETANVVIDHGGLETILQLL